MSKARCSVVRRVVAEENVMSPAAFEFRVEEILEPQSAPENYSAVRFACATLVEQLDKGKIMMRKVTEDEKKTVLASFAVLEHLILNEKP